MQKTKLLLLTGAFISGISTTTHAMFGINVGLNTGYHVIINRMYYKNYGWIKAYDRAEINVHSLTGTGSISAAKAKITCSNEYDYAGPITCTEECSIKAPKIVAPREATIEAPVITFECDEFEFRGTITCEKQCIIHAKKPFKTRMFGTRGKGSVTGIISPYAVEKHTTESLIKKTKEHLFHKLLTLTDTEIKALPREVLHYTETNSLPKELIEKQIDAFLTEEISYHTERLHETVDTQELYKGLKAYSVPALGIGLGTMGFIYRENIDNSLQAIFKITEDTAKVTTRITLGLGGTIAAIFGLVQIAPTAKHIGYWLNPRHKEKLESLTLIKTAFDEAFSTPYVSQQEIIKIR